MQRHIVLLLLMFVGSSCAYRFTNRHIKRPAGIKTIAVESVYDTSRKVIPHEILWEELQKAFVANGKLKLVSSSSADALVKAHIDAVNVSTNRIQQVDNDFRDPEITSPADAAASGEYKNFRKLSQAGEYTLQENFRYGTRIEIIDLRTRKILLNKRYGGNRVIRTSRAGDDTDAFYLIYTEAQNNSFRQISKTIARNVVEDLLISY